MTTVKSSIPNAPQAADVPYRGSTVPSKTDIQAAVDAAYALAGTVFTGDSGSGGVKGLVPAPAAGDAAANKYLKAGGSWTALAAGDISSGTLGVARGGTGTGTAFTAGSIVFAGASGVYTQDNANFFFDDTNNQLLLGRGTASLPAFGFVGDADTGAYSPSANTYAITTGGTRRINVSSGGSVSIGVIIGTNSPLEVAGNVYTRLDQNSQTTFYVVNGDTGGSATARMRLTSGTGSDFIFDASHANGGTFAAEIVGDMYIGTNAVKSTNLTTQGIVRLKVDSSGNAGIGMTPVNKLDVTGSFGIGAPVTKTADFSLAATENDIICNKAGTLTITLPAASSWTGRRVTVRTITANTVVSASSNVVPAAGGAAGTAILAATAGKSALLISDGTNWQIQLPN